MIEFTKSYQTSDGKTFAVIAEAQQHQLQLLISGMTNEIAQELIAQSAQVVDILSTKSNSRPRARRLHGATKARKAAKPTATQPTAPA